MPGELMTIDEFYARYRPGQSRHASIVDVYLSDSPSLRIQNEQILRPDTDFGISITDIARNISEFDINKWQIIYSPIYDKNNECPISYELIKTNNTYCKCSQCKYNFSKESIQIALNSNPCCPICRAEWTDKTAYINRSAINSTRQREKNTELNKTISTISDVIVDNDPK